MEPLDGDKVPPQPQGLDLRPSHATSRGVWLRRLSRPGEVNKFSGEDSEYLQSLPELRVMAVLDPPYRGNRGYTCFGKTVPAALNTLGLPLEVRHVLVSKDGGMTWGTWRHHREARQNGWAELASVWGEPRRKGIEIADSGGHV